MAKIKVCVVGTGFIGPAHIEALRRLPNVEVTALCEVNIELAASKAAQLGIERPCTFEQLLAMEDIVCVHVCAPNFLHHSQSKAALLAGKHVVCEKPLAKDLHEAEELVALAKETGLVNAVHFNLRYSLAYPAARELMSFPGGHNEGFPDTFKQLFKEVYAAVATGKQPENPPFPSFADGYRELLICERILESSKKQGWVRV